MSYFHFFSKPDYSDLLDIPIPKLDVARLRGENMDNVGLKNAIIKRTFLGFEGHGIFTFTLHLDYGGSGQGAGLICLGDTNVLDEHHGSISLIKRILTVVGVSSWEDLVGKHVRVKASMNEVEAIGNILEDKWLVFKDYTGGG